MPSVPSQNITRQDKTKHNTPRQHKTSEDKAKNKTRPHHPLIISEISVGVCMSRYAHTHPQRYLRKHERVVGPETKQETRHSCRQDKTRQQTRQYTATKQIRQANNTHRDNVSVWGGHLSISSAPLSFVFYLFFCLLPCLL